MVTATRSSDLVGLCREWSKAYRTGDESFAPAQMGHGEVAMLGSAAEDEAFIGRDAVLSVTIARAKQINQQAGVSTDVDPDPQTQAWEAGSTGWAVIHSDQPLADGATIPTRTIIVFVRNDDGSWKTVLAASHVLVPNDGLRPQSPAYAVLTGAASVRPE